LNVLDPAAHSLGYAYVLGAKAGSPKTDPAKFLNIAQRFLLACNQNQARLAGPKVAAICRRFKEMAIEGNQPLRAVKPLKVALLKLRSGSESLTPVHADFVQCCLLSKCYNAALPILQDEIFEVNPDNTGVTPKDYLLYYYYGGMIYVGLKEFSKGLGFFRMVITATAVVLSAVMVEAYKKYILISLIVHGKVVSLPRFTSSVVQRYTKSALPQYQEFATAFATHSTDELHKIAELHHEVFQKVITDVYSDINMHLGQELWISKAMYPISL